jgi:pilus assembly protein CpaC
MDAAIRLAETYASNNPAQAGVPGAEQPNVLNLLQVGGAQQVLLEVKVAEISRTFIKRLDIDFTGIYDGGSIKIGTVAGGARFPDAVISGAEGNLGGRIPAFPFDGGLIGPAINEIAENDPTIGDRGIFVNSLSGNFLFNLIIDAAREQGLAKLLAEPNLTALSGQEATFLAGGEFPIPVDAGNEGTQVSFKEFGIGLAFVPMVLDSGLVSLKVSVSVSQLSNENAAIVESGGASSAFFIPALTKRSANSSVEVPSGQTIAIAGLLNENLREGVSKFPGLGGLPVVGALFRSQEYQKGQTELVIFVTPRLARPTSPELVKLPTDDFVEPNDVEFYLMGRLQGRKPGDRPPSSRSSTLGPDNTGSEGPFGHDL